MGYSTRYGTEITDFWPDDTEREFYIPDGVHLSEILERAQEKWPDITAESLMITPEHIHAECIGYDRYDPGDYANFLRITNVK